MRLNFWFFLLLCCILSAGYAQNGQSPSLSMGDPAPPLRVRTWLKGSPFQKFEKGHVYVVEFWATWCGPCIAAMPHLSALAREYKDKVTILGIDIKEQKTTSLQKVKAFVDSMGQRMDYPVAADKNDFMATGWLAASGEQAIPRSFVVNAQGRLAWIGHPKDLAEVLQKLVSNTWDIKAAFANRKEEKRLQEWERSVNNRLNTYAGNHYKEDYIGKPDSALLLIDKTVKKEPKLKYAPGIAFHTFSALLKTNLHKAFEYGRVAIVTSIYEDPDYTAYRAIIDAIDYYSDKLNLSDEIYHLGAEAYQVRIDQIAAPEHVSIHKHYTRMAEWYWRANDEEKAVDAQQKGIEALKGKKNFSTIDLAELESRLRQYQLK